MLSFTARAEVWVTVTEAGGKQLLRRTLLAGETVALSGALPLAVVGHEGGTLLVVLNGLRLLADPIRNAVVRPSPQRDAPSNAGVGPARAGLGDGTASPARTGDL